MRLNINSAGTGLNVQTTEGMQPVPSFIELGHDLAHTKDIFKEL